MDIALLIQTAKLGRERKGAQIETCSVFAAALYDVLHLNGISCQMATAVPKGLSPWAHAVVEVDGRYYDSMGEFSASIHRARAKIHPKVEFSLEYQPDSREECYEPEFDELHAFFVKMLTKAVAGIQDGACHAARQTRLLRRHRHCSGSPAERY